MVRDNCTFKIEPYAEIFYSHGHQLANTFLIRVHILSHAFYVVIQNYILSFLSQEQAIQLHSKEIFTMIYFKNHFTLLGCEITKIFTIPRPCCRVEKLIDSLVTDLPFANTQLILYLCGRRKSAVIGYSSNAEG